MKFDFSDQTVTEASRYIHTFYDLKGDPKAWVECAPALEANRPFFNAVIARANDNLERLSGDGADAVMLEESRDEDRELYPELILTGKWGGNVDQPDGTTIKLDELECSVENRAAFLNALPPHVFDKLRNACGNPKSFTGRKGKKSAPTRKESEQIAGN